jgi:hypothetical protein
LPSHCEGCAKALPEVLDAGGRNHNDVYVSIARALGMDVTSLGRASWYQGPLIV